MAIIIIILVVFIISILWVKGITDMHEKHPDYKGDDLFGEDKEDTTNQK
jgi:quinol-cytochrome oxidoreductase complex cytochrome b subunit